MKQVLTESIRIDGDCQSRDRIDSEVVNDYAGAMGAGKKFPPLMLFFDGTDYFCADGFHRVLAAQRAGIKHLVADVQKGGAKEAAWASCGMNITHGLRRTNADKRRAVKMALEMKPDMSDRALAEHCGVANHLIAEVRRQVGVLPPGSMRQVGKFPTCPSETTAKAQVSKISPPLRETATGGRLPMPPPMRTGRDGKRYPAPPPVKFGPPPTARKVQPAGPVDDVGRLVPRDLVPLWERKDEVNAMLTALSRIRGQIKEAQELDDMLFAEISFSSVLAHLDQAYSGIQVAKPYAVCPFCQGHGCKACCKRGLVSKHRWDSVVPQDLKRQVTALIGEERNKAS